MAKMTWKKRTEYTEFLGVIPGKWSNRSQRTRGSHQKCQSGT